MTELGLEITENLQYNLGLPPEEAEELLRKELACALCEQGKLLPEGAGRFAGRPLGEFNALLQERARVRETEEYEDWEPGTYQPEGGVRVKMALKIPEEVQKALGLPTEELLPELRKELALDLYEQWILGYGVARRFAGLSWWEFFDLRGKRGIPVQYDWRDLEQDMRSARRC